jgi:D-aminopeptidase
VREAIAKATSGAVEEGNVGAGTGTEAFGFKGGIGTSSRRYRDYTVGALVQSNFGGILTIDGVPVGRELGRYLMKGDTGDGSLMMVIATDAPLDARQLKRMAKRAMLAVGRTGSPSTHGSGDYVIAISTAAAMRSRHGATGVRSASVFADDSLTPLFQAVVESTEEAIYNSLLRAQTVRGRNGYIAEAIPVSQLQLILRKFGH